MPELDRAQELLRDAKTIAVVGVKNDPEKASYYVPAYLIGAGYTVYLVNPDVTGEVLGLPVYDRAQDLPERVDIVDIFRRSEDVGPVVEDAIEAGARAIWMQAGIVNEAAAQRAREAGLEVVMDRCAHCVHEELTKRAADVSGPAAP